MSTLSTEETTPLLFTSKTIEQQHADTYQLKTRYEMGDMANLFFSPIARLLYYIAIIVYLYGDMAIYIATVPKSMANITCVYPSVLVHNLTRGADSYFLAADLSNRSNGTTVPNGLCYGMLSFMNLYR